MAWSRSERNNTQGCPFAGKRKENEMLMPQNCLPLDTYVTRQVISHSLILVMEAAWSKRKKRDFLLLWHNVILIVSWCFVINAIRVIHSLTYASRDNEAAFCRHSISWSLNLEPLSERTVPREASHKCKALFDKRSATPLHFTYSHALLSQIVTSTSSLCRYVC